MQLKLRYPAFDVRLKHEKERSLIFDFIRRKWLVLTPEEWVRQHLVNYLVSVKGYPASCIAIEKLLVLNGTRKRYDVVVFDKQKNPFLIAECKAPYIDLNTAVLEQAMRYNLVLHAHYLIISNGMSEIIVNAQNKVVDLPDYLQAAADIALTP